MHRTFCSSALVLALFHCFPLAHAADAVVVVTATRFPTRADEVLNDMTILTREQIEASSASGLADLLAAQPGVQIVANGGIGKANSLYLRGTESRHAVVLVDGMRINSATLGDSAIQHIPLSQIERIEILRGPASALYGSEAIGGVVSIITRQSSGAPRFHARAGYGNRNTAELSAGIDGSQGPLRFALTAGHLQTDGTSAIVNPGNAAYHPDADGYRQDNLSGRIGYTISPGHELGANMFYSDGVSRYDPWGAGNYDARSAHTLVGFGIESRNRLTPIWSSTLRLAESMDDSTSYTSATAKSIFKTHQTQATWQHDFKTGAGDFLAAVERLEQHVSSTTDYALTKRTVDSWLIGYRGRLGAHSVQTAIRRDDNSQFGGRTTGSAYYGYRITEAWRLSLGTGTAFSAPTFNQLYYPGFGDPGLRPERGRNREAALVWEHGHAQFSATAYRNRVTDLIATTWVGPSAYDYSARNVNRAQLTGASFTGAASVGAWRWQGNIDWLDAKDETTGKRLARRAREHGSMGVARDFGKWAINTQLVASGPRYDDVANSRRLGGYAIWNIGADYRLAADTAFLVRVTNVFDKRYELAADYASTRAALFVGIRYAPR